MSVEELAEINQSQTTWTQDAALHEIGATLFELHEENENAAAAWDNAGSIFQSDAVDAVRAHACARTAYERAPTIARAATRGDRAITLSYDADLDAASARDGLKSARAVLGRWLDDANDEELANLVNLRAWLDLRLGELASDPGQDQVSLEWLFAGVAATPGDAVLRSVLGYRLLDLEYYAAAALRGTQRSWRTATART